MKNIALFSLLIFFIACSPKNQETTDSNSNVVSDFLNDISTIEKVDHKNSIVLFQELADAEAKEIIDISKDNMTDVLASAKDYKHCVITAGDHTIVKVIDLKDCKQSGKWATCMPKVKGYIKKGSFVYQEDYMNNIIGIPDGQDRTAFLFN